MTYLFCIIKNNKNNIRCTIEGEKSNIVVQGIIPYYLFVYEEQLRNISFTVISLFILRENSLSEGEILDNKNFYKIITNQNFDYAALFKTLNDFANVICICIFREAKSANCVELK